MKQKQSLKVPETTEITQKTEDINNTESTETKTK